MKIIAHVRSPKPESMTLKTNPMTVWLSRDLQLVIEPGDKLVDIAKVIEKEWPKFGWSNAQSLAAFWFSLGEQSHRKGWKRKALIPSSARRFQPPKKS